VELPTAVQSAIDGTPRFVVHGHLAAYSHWRALAQDNEPPPFRRFDPIAIPNLLPSIILFRVHHDPLDFEWRIIGEEVRLRLGGRYAGCRLSALPGQGPGTRIWQNFERTVQARLPRWGDVAYVGPDKHVRELQDLILPFHGDDRRIGRLLVYVEFKRVP